MKSSEKIFKDPIYGYISIPKSYIDIIDSPSFQRLRRISQTSYAPLYSSALHNRFVHSMGVFHLATIATNHLKEHAIQLFRIEFGADDSQWEFNYFDVFELACLLHDVGHAPFSHTGEKYFLLDDEHVDFTAIHEELKDLVKEDKFCQDVDALQTNYASPHEIMSAIIGLKQYDSFLCTDKIRAFFARCITGYQYGNSDRTRKINSKEKLLNCLISLLNSKVIDVDKLDYLIRDAYIIGYDTVKLDYVRLLKALTIVKDGGDYKLAFDKSAVSVIENVIYARDAEKKWIQSHPVVMYENYLVQKMIEDFIAVNGKTVFSSESLCPAGIDSYGKRFRLLCDDDIVAFIKNDNDNALANQFFDRSKRMHAIWKSEADYNVNVDRKLNDAIRPEFLKFMKKFFNTYGKSSIVVIDDKYLKQIQELYSKYKDEYDKNGNLDNEESYKFYEVLLSIVNCLLSYARENEMKEEYIIMRANCFDSGFNSKEFKTLKIDFGEKIPVEFKDVVRTLFSHDDDETQQLFYLFYYRNKDESCKDLCKKLVNCFDSNWQ